MSNLWKTIVWDCVSRAQKQLPLRGRCILKSFPKIYSAERHIRGPATTSRHTLPGEDPRQDAAEKFGTRHGKVAACIRLQCGDEAFEVMPKQFLRG